VSDFHSDLSAPSAELLDWLLPHKRKTRDLHGESLVPAASRRVAEKFSKNRIKYLDMCTGVIVKYNSAIAARDLTQEAPELVSHPDRKLKN